MTNIHVRSKTRSLGSSFRSIGNHLVDAGLALSYGVSRVVRNGAVVRLHETAIVTSSTRHVDAAARL